MNKTANNQSVANHVFAIFSENLHKDFIYDTVTTKTITYHDFFTYIFNGIAFLRNQCNNGSEKVGLILNNSLELFILYFSALFSGKIIIPIDPLKKNNEVYEILTEGKCSMIVHNDKDRFSDWDKNNQQILLDSIRNKLFQKQNNLDRKLELIKETDFSSLFLISFTSGSTGKPKGVMHSFKNLFQTSMALKSRFDFNENNIFYHNIPMTYMAGILNLFILPFLSGSKIVLGERFNITNILNFWEDPIRYEANTFCFIPTILSLLIKTDRSNKGLDYTKRKKITAFVATAPLNKKLQDEFEGKYNIELYESYGLTETLFVSTRSPKDKNQKYGVGKVLDGVKILFNDDNEILIDVPWQFLGYYNIEDHNNIKNGAFITGDVGKIDNSGELIITGRKKDIIIRGGINISPKKIEDVISNSDLLKEFTIIGIEDNTLGEKIVCFYENQLEELNKEKKKEIMKLVLEILGKNYQIDEFFELKQIYKNLNGKVDKQKIKEHYYFTK